MKTVIMAGGRGTRINALFPDLPKPLIPVTSSSNESKPVLAWEIKSLASQGFKDIIITIGYRAPQIENYFGDGSSLGVSITYFVEDTPLGNAGALFKLRPELGEKPFLLLNADALFDINFKRFLDFHKAKGGLVSLFTHPNSHPYDSGLIISNSSGVVISWLTKEDDRPEWYKNRVNAGLHIVDPSVLDSSGIDAESVGKEGSDGKIIKVDLDRQLLQPLCNTGRMYAYDSPEYVKDMGTPERYEQVCLDFAAGLVEAKNLKNKQKAIFLDRDGTINKYVGFLKDIDKFELIDNVAEAVRKINSSGYLVIVVTNQPVIARGEVTVSQLNQIHEKLETMLGKNGAYIDGLYYCPHHPCSGYTGEIKELKIECDCRKPKPGMILRAAQDFNLDLKHSWMIGDGERDVKAGKAAGTHTVLISSSLEDDYGAEMVAGSLLEAVEKIVGK